MRSVAFVFLWIVSLSGSLFAQAPPANWIWSAQDSDRPFFRKVFNVEGDIKSAIAVVTADNGFVLFVNKERVASGKSWENLEKVDLTGKLKSGENIIAVSATDEGGAAGFLLDLRMTAANGSVQQVVTDASWMGATQAKGDWKGKATDGSWKPVRTLGQLSQRGLPWTQNVNATTVNALFASGDGSAFIPEVASEAKTRDGFQVEKIYSVPRSMGSWVSLTTDNRGGLIASDQGGAGLFRIVPGKDKTATEVSRIPVDLSGAQGLLWAFDSLYAMVNGGPKSGLHRITDSNSDGELDKVEHIIPIDGGGEHGPHAVVLSPDKKSLMICAGNHTKLPKEIANSRIPRNWGEDLLLPRRWDANGHAAGILAPGGWICKVDPDGKNIEVHSIGFRNQYDIAFNADGELFSYDADMEWDLGSPWYRPTRVVHATSGSEFGWRSGTGKWPTYYEDSLPPVVDIGPGSPVGIVFGYGAKFPLKYQRALFILDWTYSTIYAVHLTPEGSTYKGEREDFVTGQPLQVTDAIIGEDGALYFAAGGRGTQSSLYRVTYVGDEAVAAGDYSDSTGTADRARRQKLEALHGESQASNLQPMEPVLGSLGDSDRFVRYAARLALEARPIDSWIDKVSRLKDNMTRINGAIAIARQGSSTQLPINLELLGKINADELDSHEKLAWLRAYQLSFARLGEPTAEQRQAVLGVLDAIYPSKSDAENAELVQLLVYLNAPNVVGRTLQLMQSLGSEPAPDWGYLVERHKSYGGTVGGLLENMPPGRAIHFAFVLRNQKTGWTMDQRRQYLRFFIDAAKYPGGNSYAKFLEQMRDDALLTCTPEERVMLDDLARESLVAKPPKVDPPKGPGREWTRDESLQFVSKLQKQDFERGRNLFHAAQCAKCHRLGGEGGAIGPDLSTAGRKYPLPDLMDAIIDPSKAISDQYGSTQVLTSDGGVVVGRMVKLDNKVHIYTADPDKPPVIIDEEDVESMTPSAISQMPTGLVDGLNEEELKDLVAYLLSGGNRRDQVYK
jgi:putative heme-binding domain-containing protein